MNESIQIQLCTVFIVASFGYEIQVPARFSVDLDVSSDVLMEDEEAPEPSTGDELPDDSEDLPPSEGHDVDNW